MEPADLRSWLRTAESKAVGWPKDRGPDEELVGHASGRRILLLLKTAEDKLTDDDLQAHAQGRGVRGAAFEAAAEGRCEPPAVAVFADELGARSAEVSGVPATRGVG